MQTANSNRSLNSPSGDTVQEAQGFPFVIDDQVYRMDDHETDSSVRPEAPWKKTQYPFIVDWQVSDQI